MYGVPLIIFQWLFTCTMRSICLNTLTVKRLHELVIELIVQNRFTTLWFLGTLFFLNLIFYFLVNYIKNKTVQKIIVFVITTGGVLYYNIGGKSLPWNIDICMTSLIFFYYGYNYKIDDRMNKAFLKFNVYIKIVVECTLTILCCFLSYCLSGKEFDMFGNNYGYPLIAFPTAFLGIASTISISKLVTIRLIEYIGKNSMIFFTWHQVIAFPLVLIFLTKVGFVWNESWTSLHIALYDVSVLLLSIMMLSCCNGIIKSTNKKIKNLMKIKL